jgi:Holliday junction DNA helicase RuvA
MIHRLRGILVEKDSEGVVLDVGGVGYRASASLATLRALPSLGEERLAFDALTAVSKVGPKLALAVLSSMTPPEIAEAVARGDVLKLASVPGLGRKTAERLVLELKGKNLVVFGTEPAVASDAGGGPYMEAREALTGLGYSLEEAEKALNDVPPQETVEKYIKEALRRIGSRR